MADVPQRVAVNALFLEPGMGGVETYLLGLVPALLEERPGLQLTVFANAAGARHLRAQPWGGEVAVVSHPLLGVRGGRALTELTVLGVLAARGCPDVLHSVAMTGPLVASLPHVVTLHDTTWLDGEDPDMAATFRLWRAIIPPVVRRADRVIAVSQATADDAAARLRVDHRRIDVVPHGADLLLQGEPTPPGVLRRRLALGDGPLVLCVAAKKTHKNLGRLIDAMPAIRRTVAGATLVLAGAPSAHENELRSRAHTAGVADAVRFLGYVDGPDLEGLYRAAGCLVLPSLNEGFGFPVLEAMGRRLPVACSRAGALPEVAGDAALLFDPLDVTAIADAVIALLSDRALADDLVGRGHRRRGRYTWKAAAAGTLESYARAVVGGR